MIHGSCNDVKKKWETMSNGIILCEVYSFIGWIEDNMDFRDDEDIIYGDTETPLGVQFAYGKSDIIRVVYGDKFDWSNTSINIYIPRELCHPIDGRTIITEKQLDALYLFRSNPSRYLYGEILDAFNDAFPWLNAHNGAKAHKVFKSICKHFGLDRDPEFIIRYTKFADAINPLVLTHIDTSLNSWVSSR